MKACRYIYNVWSIIVGFIGRSRVSRRCLLERHKLILKSYSGVAVDSAEFALHAGSNCGGGGNAATQCKDLVVGKGVLVAVVI